MTNVIPVEQDDIDSIPLITTGDQVLGFDPENPEAGNGPSNRQAEAIANSLLYLRKRALIQGEWDPTATVVASDCVANNAYSVEATLDTTDEDSYTFTPVGGSSMIKVAGSAVAAVVDEREQWGRIKLGTAGGNYAAALFMLANEDATLEDVLAVTLGGSGPSVTHIVVVAYDVNGGLFGTTGQVLVRHTDPVNGSESFYSANTGAAGDDLRVGVDFGTGTVKVKVGANAVESSADPFDLTGVTGMRPFAAAFFTDAADPTYTDTDVEFDLCDTTDGRDGFSGNVAAAPEGAADGYHYIVTANASYNGIQLKAGDLVQFAGALSTLFVTRMPLSDAELADEIANVIDELQLVSLDLGTYVGARGMIDDLNNDATDTPVALGKGYTVLIVGEPSGGAFDGMTQGNFAVSDGAQWVELSSQPLLAGRTWSVGTGNYPLKLKKEVGIHLIDEDINDAGRPVFVNASATTIVLTNLTSLGWGVVKDEINDVQRTSVHLGAADTAATVLAYSVAVQVVQVDDDITVVVDPAQQKASHNTFAVLLLGHATNAYAATIDVGTINFPEGTASFGVSEFDPVINVPAAGAVMVHFASDRVRRTVTITNVVNVGTTADFSNGNSVGRMYMFGNSTATTVGAIGTFYKAAGTTGAGTLLRFSHASGTLTYDGAVPVRVQVNVASSISCANNNQLVHGAITLNGTVQSDTTMSAFVHTSNNPVALHTSTILDLEPGDDIELHVANLTATNDLTVEALQMTITEVS
jgi:hypothetical protein